MGRGEHRFVVVDTPWGPGGLVAGPRGLIAAVLPGFTERELLARITSLCPGASRCRDGLVRAERAFADYFRTGRVAKPWPRLDLSGAGAFDAAIYTELGRVGRGETVTYAELARRIGRPGANRAVGAAVARNRIPLFIPCHRVVRSDGGLGGYRAEGGVGLKRAMLALEQANRPANPPDPGDPAPPNC